MHEMQEPPRQQDPRRGRIARLLRDRVGENAEQFYRDACQLVDGDPALETATHLIGHCAREIESAVREVVVVLVVPADQLRILRRNGAKSNATHRAEVEAIVSTLDLPRDGAEAELWLDLAAGAGTETRGLAAMTHRRAHQRAPRLDDDVRSLWRRFEGLIVVLLRAIESRFAALLPTLRELAALQVPDGHDLRRLRELPNTYVTRREFFDHATPGWLDHLDRAGFFAEPPLPVLDLETGTATMQHWPAADYLARLATIPACQERFVEITGHMDIPHEFAARALMLGARALPIGVRARYTNCLIRWIGRQQHVFMSSRDLAAFVADVARDGRPDIAAAIAALTLDLLPDPTSQNPRTEEEDRWFRPSPRARLEDHDYEEFVKHAFPEIVTADATAALDAALPLLEKALAMSERASVAERHMDTSVYWLPSVVHRKNRVSVGHLHAVVLGEIVRDAALALVRTDPARQREITDRLAASGWPLLRRIAVHIIGGGRDRDQIREALLAADLLELDWPEYRSLLQERFKQLDDADQREHMRLVEARAPRTTYASGEPVDQAAAVRWLAAWRISHLQQIVHALPEDLQVKYTDELRQEPVPVVQEPEGPGADLLRADVLAAMPVAAVIQHLATWQPAPRRMSGPTIEMQADEFRAAVLRAPARFAAVASSFVGHEPTYVRALLWGLQEAVDKQKSTFDWGPVLKLASWVVEQPVDHNEGIGFDRDPGWTWTRKEIADLLRSGLDSNAPVVPHEHDPAIWGLLEALVEDLTRTSSDDRRDALSASLNSTRGSAMHSLIEYVAWMLGEDAGTRPAMRIVPKAGVLLERHLDPAIDDSAATRGAVGSRLGQLVALDRDWVLAHRDRLFPADYPNLADMTWSSYVPWNSVRRDVLEAFLERYTAAIARLDPLSTAPPADPDEALVGHVLMAYIRGWIDLRGGLVRDLYARGSDRLRAFASEYVGRVLEDTGAELRPEHCERARALWSWRRRELEGAALGVCRGELEGFGWWFVTGQCDDEWLLEELLAVLRRTGSIEPDSGVMERLAAIAPTRPHDAVTAVDLLTLQPKNRWFVHAELGEIRMVLQSGLAATDSRTDARAVLNRLVADGYRDFADLLDG